MTSACTVFAEKGYRDTTIAEICEKANANIAAVNYHFGDKESLYSEVWQHAFTLTSEAFPIRESLPESPELEDILFSFAFAILQRIFSEDAAGWFPKLLHQEMSNPTLALEQIENQALAPQRQYLDTALRADFPPTADEQAVPFCLHSIIAQCAFFNFSRPLRKQVLGKKNLSQEDIRAAATHIARFSLGGIREIQHEQ